jgi:hypothetical protein
VVAELFIEFPTISGEASGFVSKNSAATPATCGVAIEVPSTTLVALSLVYQVEVTA